MLGGKFATLDLSRALFIVSIVASVFFNDLTFAQTPLSPRDAAAAARANAAEELRLDEQRQAQTRERDVQTSTVRSAVPQFDEFPALPQESPCFVIQSFRVTTPETLPAPVRALGTASLPQDPFAFLSEWLSHYEGQCIGQQGVDRLTKALGQAVLSRGYITTRIVVPEQHLVSGELVFQLIPGAIHAVRFPQEMYGTWRNAFPVREGELLDLRALEQGLEQMKRVPSQDIDMQIVPGAAPGMSDVIINVKRTRPWKVVASLDNAGSRAMGRLQGGLSVGWDNPLGLSDLFNVGVSRDVPQGQKDAGVRGWNAFYTVPWGYWTGTLSGSANDYYQRIAGANQSFLSRGESQYAELKLHRVMSRRQNNVFGMQFRLFKRFGKSFIEDTEIRQQHRNNTFFEIGLTHRHFFGDAQFDLMVAHRQGVPWMGAQSELTGLDQTYRYKMQVLDANLSVPFHAGPVSLRYLTTFHGQTTANRLFYVDSLAIGGRYTVRGFDGEYSLTAERGFYWRNALEMPLGNTRQALYLGFDYGQVSGPSAKFLTGRQLAGAVLGLRGGWRGAGGSLSYDVFAGTPVMKPADFITARTAVGFQLTYQY